MKQNIHPAYKQTKFVCSCGAEFMAGSTVKEDSIRVEICSNCHPFYTDKQRLVDTQGVLDKFYKKLQVSQDMAKEQEKIEDRRGKKVAEKEQKRKEKLAKEVGIKDLSKIIPSSVQSDSES